MTVIRQKVPLTAAGRNIRGFEVSEAAIPTNSVPANENAAVTNTAQIPWKPFASGPGSRQYWPPTYSNQIDESTESQSRKGEETHILTILVLSASDIEHDSDNDEDDSSEKFEAASP